MKFTAGLKKEGGMVQKVGGEVRAAGRRGARGEVAVGLLWASGSLGSMRGTPVKLVGGSEGLEMPWRRAISMRTRLTVAALR